MPLPGLREERLDRAFGFMREYNLDVLVAASTDSIQNRGNVRFLTNYATVFGTSLAVLPYGGNPILLVPAGSFQHGWALEAAWATDVRASQDLGVAVIGVLGEVGGRASTVGVVGFEHLPDSLDTQLSAAFPTMSLRRVTLPFLLMRSAKTSLETAMVRQSVALADEVLTQLPSVFRVGVAESEIFARTKYWLTRGGAEDVLLMGSSVLRTPMPVAAQRALQQHDVMHFSIEPAASGGFWIQTVRVISLGTPTREVQAAFELCAESLDQGSLLLKPGITGGQIAQAMIQVLKRAGSASIGPMGHGMGLDLTEPPYLRPEDDTVVEPGMVVTIHPYLTWGSIGIWTGDTFLVTERGAERLSADRGELLVVAPDG